MGIHIDAIPYSSIVLHALKYPAKGVFGLLFGKKNANGINVDSIVPLAHESAPLAPTVEIALSLCSPRNDNIIGVYFANAGFDDTSLNLYAVRIAERIAAVNGGSPLLLQVVNSKLTPDSTSNSIVGYLKSGDSWSETKVSFSDACLLILRTAIHRKLYRDVVDFDNHLDKPELDFYNTELCLTLSQITA